MRHGGGSHRRESGCRCGLLTQLEGIVDAECILATNTSSLSVSAIATACRYPQRVAGFHFFNPVPLMRVVEVIDGIATDPAVSDALLELARRMGHTGVRARTLPVSSSTTPAVPTAPKP